MTTVDASDTLGLIIHALPTCDWTRLDMRSVIIPNNRVAELVLAIRQSKLRYLVLNDRGLGDHEFYFLTTEIYRHRLFRWKFRNFRRGYRVRRDLAKQRNRMRSHVRKLYESLLLERATTPVARFLNRDGDNAIMTGVLRFML